MTLCSIILTVKCECGNVCHSLIKFILKFDVSSFMGNAILLMKSCPVSQKNCIAKQQNLR